MDVGAGTDIGLVRERNEDALLVDEDLKVFVVADGMGGHPAGHVASRLAVDAIERSLEGGGLDDGGADRALQAALRAAHRAVVEGAIDEPARAGMGTTAVLTHLEDGDAWVAHVGDSRAYLLRDRQLHRITTDHTTGGASRRGAISQALGASSEVAPDVVHLETRPGDRLLLCTDGLTDMVDDDTIGELLASGLAPQETCDRLIELAKQRGGRDNVTVIVVDV